MDWRVEGGDARAVLAGLPAQSVQTCITSPPYFGLRDYGTGEWEGGDSDCDHLKVADRDAAVATSTLGGGKKTTGHIQEGFKDNCGKCGARRVDRQIGLEPTPDEFVAALVGVFREVRRVLRDDGTVWLNLGDSYCSTAPGTVNAPERIAGSGGREGDRGEARARMRVDTPPGMKPKDLMGIPWMVAFALQADGWYLRSDIIWAKPNPMPESVTDRPTKAHEYLFLLSKERRYYYDREAIREPVNPNNTGAVSVVEKAGGTAFGDDGKPIGAIRHYDEIKGPNKRSVWTVATQPYPGAHFATFPPKLIEPCVLAGSRPDDVVLDPFAGAGTTGLVAVRNGRSFIGVELNPKYVEMARGRIEAATAQGTLF